ncbi:Uncharacterised protein [Escherichia coli]|uniref:Uncharacterized protein n=1 Tax=Escherichia coli TaxID=562 RepID=A0A376TJ43_ECOLX|nr:Uncharacterised protein [Escherichia coli]
MARRLVFIRWEPDRMKLDTWNQTDFVKVKKFAGLLAARIAQTGQHNLASGGG